LRNLSLCTVALVALTTAPALADEDMTIHMGTMSWEDLTPITYVTKAVLESQGFTVEVEEFSEWGIVYAALANGDIDILASQTDYAAHDYWVENMDDLEKLSPVSHGLYQAIAVPSYVGITSLTDLAANAEAFGGKIIGIEPGSGLMSDAANAVDTYAPDMDLVEGSTAAMVAALDAATARQEWIAVTVWEPSWMMSQYDLRFLADPEAVFPAAQSYYWIATRGFAAAHPHAREAIASVYLPLDDITAINAAMNGGMTMEEASNAWVAAHADLVGRWTAISAE